MKPDTDSFLPLAPAALHILLALSGGDLHGYGIMQEIDRQSGGRCRIGPGTLYDNIQRLLEQSLVEESSAAGDSRRRTYRLTTLGCRVLAAELARLDTVVRDGTLRLQSLRPRRA